MWAILYVSNEFEVSVVVEVLTVAVANMQSTRSHRAHGKASEVVGTTYIHLFGERTVGVIAQWLHNASVEMKDGRGMVAQLPCLAKISLKLQVLREGCAEHLLAFLSPLMLAEGTETKVEQVACFCDGELPVDRVAIRLRRGVGIGIAHARDKLVIVCHEGNSRFLGLFIEGICTIGGTSVGKAQGSEGVDGAS